MIEIGRIEALYRYPVKSMAGEALDAVDLGWNGVDGDRRLALRRLDDRSGFPWLSAGRLPELLVFRPLRRDATANGLPSHVRTPEGKELEIFGDELASEIGSRHGTPVEMTYLKHGIFDDGGVSVIASTTIDEIARVAGVPSDARRFRPNILVRPLQPLPFQEDEWLDGTLRFGDAGDAPLVAVTMKDARCAMINFDPETAAAAPEMLKSAVRLNQNFAGVYGAVARTGRLAVGQTIRWEPARSAIPA